MKPLFLALALLAMPFGMGPALAQSSPDALHRVTGVAAGGTLNLRRGPATSHPVIGKLAADRTGLRLIGCDDAERWCEVDAGADGTGWAAARYLLGPPVPRAKPATEPTTAPAPRAKTRPSDAPAWRKRFPANTAYRVTGIGVGGTLNVRAGPGTDTAKVATLPAKQSGLSILDCTDVMDWCQVSTQRGPLGWVSARYLGPVAQVRAPSARMVQRPRRPEATRLAAATGIPMKPGKTASIPKLPPYLLGIWDTDADACKRRNSEARVIVQPNGLRVGASNARFKNALFRDEGYDLIAVLMDAQDVPTSIPQRALYRLEPKGATLALSGDVLATRVLRRCVRKHPDR